MKKSNLVVILFCFSFFLSGCDWVRAQLGMPTSRELDVVRQKTLLTKTLLTKVDSLAIKGDTLTKVVKDSVIVPQERFHIIVGSFKDSTNSKKMVDMLTKNGYRPTLIQLKNGYTLVSAASFNNQADASKEMYNIMKMDFAPEDIWVYDNNQKLHIK